MQFSEMYGTALDRELGTDDNAVLFTTVRRKAAVNDAVKEFARLTECFVRDGTIALVDETAEYEIETGISAADYVKPTGINVRIVWTDTSAVTHTISGDDLKLKSPSRMDKEEPGWRDAEASTPSGYYFRQDGANFYVGLTPPPDIAAGETWNVIVPYVALPADLSADADEPYMVSTAKLTSLRPWHRGIVKFAASFLEPFRRDVDAAKRLYSEGLEVVADYLKSHRVRGNRVMFARDYRGERGCGFSTDEDDE